MTAPALRELYAVRDRALADPDINTSAGRATRLRKTVATLERAAADVPATRCGPWTRSSTLM